MHSVRESERVRVKVCVYGMRKRSTHTEFYSIKLNAFDFLHLRRVQCSISICLYDVDDSEAHRQQSQNHHIELYEFVAAFGLSSICGVDNLKSREQPPKIK